MNVDHDVSSSGVFTDAFASRLAPQWNFCVHKTTVGAGLAREGRNSVRRPVAHPHNAFTTESWLKASPIRIAPLPAKDRLATASVLSLARPI
jgi:hypothetical protein